MNEKIVEQLLQYMEQSKDFILQEAPELITQIFVYQKVWNWCCLFASLFFIVLSASVFLYFYLYPSLDKYDSLTSETVIGRMLSIPILVMSIASFACSVEMLLKIYIAPKYLLINLILNLKK